MARRKLSLSESLQGGALCLERSREASRRKKVEPLGVAGFHWLARTVWRKRKGGHARRILRRLLVAIYRVSGSPVLPNTSCSGAVMSAGGSCASAIALPT